MKKEVLFVVDEQMYGGICSVLKAILKNLDYSKYNIDLLILHNRGNSLEDVPKEVNIIYGTDFFDAIDLTVGNALKSGKIFKKIQTVFYLKTGLIKNRIKKERKKILSKRYDIEIAFKDGFCALFTAVGDSKKKVSWLHVSYDISDCTSKYRNMFRKIYSKINTVVAITEDVKKSFNDIYKQGNKVRIIENVIDIEMILEKSKEDNCNFDENKLNLICVGRIAYQKAFPRLIEQLARLKKDNLLEDVVLHIVGDGPEKDILDKMISENNMEENIDFLGYQENPYQYIIKSDMLLLPSFFEGLGLVLVEANLLGVPCFATKFANVENTLGNGKYGYIVENTSEGVYQGLKDLLQNREKIYSYKDKLQDYKYDKNDIIMAKINDLLSK